MKIDQEARMTIRHLCSKGVSNREVGCLLGVSESSVRYHRNRPQGAVDGRSKQPQLAQAWSEAIEHYISSIGRDGPLNLAALHEWLIAEMITR